MNTPNPINIFLSRQLPAILWAIFIFVASSIPNITLPKIKFLSVDKLVHTGVFYVLGLLVYRAIYKSENGSTINIKRLALVACVTTLYGISDEVHQLFVVNRVCDIYDMIADGLGGVVAGLTIYIFIKWKIRKNNNIINLD